MSRSKVISLYRLQPKCTAFFLCDVQEKFRPVIPLLGSLIENTSKLLCTAKTMGIPLFVTEQYPKGLGHTVKELSTEGACIVHPKAMFSMLDKVIQAKLNEVFGKKPRTVVLFGIEAHICVEQTAMDLIGNKIDVWLVADCVASRLNQDRDVAIERLRDIGCLITTSESVIFNLLSTKDHKHFKTLSQVVRKKSRDMHLWRPTQESRN